MKSQLRKILFPFLFVFFVYTPSNAKIYDFNRQCRDAYSSIFKLDIPKAKQLLKQETTNQNLIPVLLENYIDFLTILLGEEKTNPNYLKSVRSRRLEMIENNKSSSEWHHHSLANLHMQWAFIRLRQGEMIGAALDLRSAYQYVEKNRAAHPRFIPDMLVKGLLDIILGSIPESYLWAMKISGMSGDAVAGRKALYEVLHVCETNPAWAHMRIETLFYLAFIEAGSQDDKSSLQNLLNKLDEENLKNNILVCYLKTNVLRRLGRNDDLINAIDGCLRLPASKTIPSLAYFAATARLNRLDNQASYFFLNYINQFPDKGYVKSSYLRLAWMALIQGDLNVYRNYLGKVVNEGISENYEDKQALQSARENNIPNVSLLKARLLFDGGYYDSAYFFMTKHITSRDLQNRTDSIEFHYRLGRISVALNKTNTALYHYRRCIEIGKNSGSHYPALSALYAGQIHEDRNELDKAKEYYKLCTTMKYKPYQESISARAKMAIQRIDEKKRPVKR